MVEQLHCPEDLQNLLQKPSQANLRCMILAKSFSLAHVHRIADETRH